MVIGYETSLRKSPSSIAKLRKISCVNKINSPLPGAQQEIFQDRRGVLKLGHFNKTFVKNARKKKDPAGKTFGAFSATF